jgi:hypothetical protein
MSLTTYCEFDEVRSALGVNDVELRDSVLGLPVYEMGLVRELNKLSTSLNAAFSTVQSKTPAERTEEESALFEAVRLFSVYSVAKQVGVSLANFAPKDVGDGKATISRFAGEPFEKVLARISEMYTALRVELRAAYDIYAGTTSTVTPTTTPATVFLASKRSYDPVAGE